MSNNHATGSMRRPTKTPYQERRKPAKPTRNEPSPNCTMREDSGDETIAIEQILLRASSAVAIDRENSKVTVTIDSVPRYILDGLLGIDPKLFGTGGVAERSSDALVVSVDVINRGDEDGQKRRLKKRILQAGIVSVTQTAIPTIRGTESLAPIPIAVSI